jgi:hypothetical protein
MASVKMSAQTRAFGEETNDIQPGIMVSHGLINDVDGIRTAGFHQLSIRKTREASVRLRATPPAFKLTRKTVTCVLFTK